MPTRKQKWTIEQWADFGRKCLTTCRLLDEARWLIEGTLGMNAACIDAILSVNAKLETAMIGSENVLLSQHPEASIGLIHGAGHEWREPPLPKPTRTRDSGGRRPAASRGDWERVGHKVKEARQSIHELIMDFQSTCSATKPYVRRFIMAERAIDRAKSRLDDLVCRQHPDWREASRVFYGPLHHSPTRWPTG